MNLKPLLLVSAVAVAGAANATLLAGWTFNDATANGSNLGSVPAASASTGTGSFSTNIVRGTVGANPSGIGSFAGTTDNAFGGAVAGQALAVQGGTASGTTDNNGKYVQFSVSTSGYQDTILSYSTRGTSTGFNTQTVAYSINGGTSFTTLGTNSDARNTTFATKAFSLAAVPTSDNIANLILRITFTGASAQGGNNRIDNVQINATQAVPEPASMVALGLGAVAMIRRRRSAK